MSIEFEKSYIKTQMVNFEDFFNKNADENLNEFLMYLNERTNRRILDEIEDLNNSINFLNENLALIMLKIYGSLPK